MLSLFPELLYLAPLAAFIIRIALGGYLLYLARGHLRTSSAQARIYGALEGLCALLLIAGAYTQAAAILVFFLLLLPIFLTHLRIFPRSTEILLIMMSAVILITGAGPFAFDLPL